MNLRTLSHEEFLRYAEGRALLELECEMLRRLEDLSDVVEIAQSLDAGGLNVQDIHSYLHLLSDYDMSKPAELEATLDKGFAYQDAALAFDIESPDQLKAALKDAYAYKDVVDSYGIESLDDLISILEQNPKQ